MTIRSLEALDYNDLDGFESMIPRVSDLDKIESMILRSYDPIGAWSLVVGLALEPLRGPHGVFERAAVNLGQGGTFEVEHDGSSYPMDVSTWLMTNDGTSWPFLAAAASELLVSSADRELRLVRGSEPVTRARDYRPRHSLRFVPRDGFRLDACVTRPLCESQLEGLGVRLPRAEIELRVSEGRCVEDAQRARSIKYEDGCKSFLYTMKSTREWLSPIAHLEFDQAQNSHGSPCRASMALVWAHGGYCRVAAFVNGLAVASSQDMACSVLQAVRASLGVNPGSPHAALDALVGANFGFDCVLTFDATGLVYDGPTKDHTDPDLVGRALQEVLRGYPPLHDRMIRAAEPSGPRSLDWLKRMIG